MKPTTVREERCPVPHQELQALLDRDQIVRVIYRYCRAVDRKDYDALLAVFHPEARMVQNGVEFLVADFRKSAFLEIMNNFVITHHLIGNILIDIDGDQAQCEAYLRAYHRVSATAQNKDLLSGHQVGVEEDFVVCGRYINRLARRGGAWKLEHRTLVHDWERWDPANDRGFCAWDISGPNFG
jgi:3-phenylpropionate/cinnamic acid dioxygenase small subunit